MEGRGRVKSVASARFWVGESQLGGAGLDNVGAASQEQYDIIVSDGPRCSLTENHRSYEPSVGRGKYLLLLGSIMLTVLLAERVLTVPTEPFDTAICSGIRSYLYFCTK